MSIREPLEVVGGEARRRCGNKRLDGPLRDRGDGMKGRVVEG